ncbi:hypothetical protein FGG08_003075 [Glutinoglossum americanum]|uniref:Uncharacterized protein n=1 Tax=Glutinoglossum americanum TaxID=1670608 RepID=A0A9P8L3Z3_9PEZI|nr:hypothetical protein FGG08_003075 [Glutinoglossum americanum]
MASFVAVYRLSARVAGGQLKNPIAARGLRTSASNLAAQNFMMPAMSPTMTEGNISTWKIKEGESFSAGDVLLEIETDKAQMDVEAQEDGKMAKITQGDGTKGVKVGSRIAVIADSNDDLSTLRIPSEEPTSIPSPQEESSTLDRARTSESQAGASPTSKPPFQKSAASEATSQGSIGTPSKQRLPLLPSVAHLLQSHSLPTSEADKIPATGPKGRLLKGDVLAYVGSVSSTYPKSLSDNITSRGHLDLSNIKLSPAPVQQKPTAQATSPPPPQESKVGVSVNFSEVMKVQQRIERKLGICMPLSTFIARATDIANDDLPLPCNAKPSQDDLFNQILGLDALMSKTARGSFTLQVTALPTLSTGLAPKPSKGTTTTGSGDIIDILTGSVSRKTTAARSMDHVIVPSSAHAATTNVISVMVPAGDERRGRLFLGRVKAYLESEPGRLVL